MYDNSFYYLLWGWLVFAASLSHFIILRTESFSHPEIVWMLMPVGGIMTALYSIRKKRNKHAKTYVDEFMKYVLIAFLVCLLISLFLQGKLQLNTYPVVLMVYGFWLFISGGAIKFKPLVIGGVINWLCAVAAFFVAFDMQLLLLATAVLLGYIIPGYMLRTKHQKQTHSAHMAI
jgi:hypothetical protein